MKIKRFIISIFVTLLAVALGIFSASALYYNYIQNQLNNGDKDSEELVALEGALKENRNIEEPFYIMLLGSDARSGDITMGERSDTNIVVRVDPIKNVITLVSIPRDTKIEIEGHGTQKFNAAYAFDGAPGAIKAANELLDIEISYYAEVNFESLMSLVDTLGGIEIDVDVKIDDVKADYNSAEQHNVIEPGLQILNGSQALSFARSRAFADGDFTRQLHQRMVIEAIIDKVVNAPITQIPSIVQEASKTITTNLSIEEIVVLANHFKQANDLEIYSCMIPSTTAYINGTSYVINNHEATIVLMKLVNEGKDPADFDASLYPDVSIDGASIATETNSYDYTFNNANNKNIVNTDKTDNGENIDNGKNESNNEGLKPSPTPDPIPEPTSDPDPDPDPPDPEPIPDPDPPTIDIINNNSSL